MEMVVPMALESFTMDAGLFNFPSFTAFIPQYSDQTPITGQPNVVACAAYDIGSGATKFMGALINTESLTIEQVFSQGSFSVSYREDLHQSGNNTFSDLIQEMGLDALQKAHYQIEQDYLNTNLQGYGDIQHFAVATAAFRAADNGEWVAEMFSDKLEIPIRIISQEEEGKLAYYSALSQNPESAQDSLPIVWDIGGGSMQVTYKDTSDTFHIMESEIASQTFQALVSEKVKAFEDGSLTPNPMSSSDVDVAITLAKEYLQFDATSTDIIKNKIAEGTPLLAVGSVHNFGIQPLCTIAGIDSTKDHYTKSDLLLAIDLLTDKTDQQIMQLNHLPNVAFAKGQLTNLILVYAMMDLLGVEQVQTIKSSNVEGLLVMNAKANKQPIASPIFAHKEELHHVFF